MSINAEAVGRDAREMPVSQVQSAAGSLSAQLEMVPVPPDDFDAEIVHYDGVCQEMTHIFAVNRWAGVAPEPWVFTRNGEAVAGVLMMVQPLPAGLGSLAVAKWGPALKHEDDANGEAVYEAAIRHLQHEYADTRGMMLSVMPRASKTPRNSDYETLLRLGFKAGSKLKFPNRYIVSLRQDDAALRKSFGQKWRYHLKKSEKEGLTFEHAGAEGIAEFDQLYQAMADRKNFPDHSAYDTVAELMKTPVDGLRPELFFVRHEGELVAGAIIFKAGKTAVYLYGATNDRALPLRAGYFMHWHIIRWLRDHAQADWYDLGGTDGFQGLHQFKKGMVGSAGVIEPVPPVTNYASHLKAKLIGNAAYAARDGLQQVRRVLNNLRSDAAKPDQERS